MLTPANTSQTFLTTGSLTRDQWNELMILFRIVSESFDRNPFSVVAALIPFAHTTYEGKRSHNSMDQVLKLRSASSRPSPEGNRAFVAVRHQKSSPLISAQTRHRPTDCFSRNPESHVIRSINMECFWMPKTDHQIASSSSGRNGSQNPSDHASGY